MASWTATKFQSFSERKHTDINISTDTIVLTLTNIQPSSSGSDEWADESSNELASGNGYPGGYTLSKTFSQSTGTANLVGSANIVISASGGNIGPFQFAIARSTTPTGEPLMWYYTRSAAYTVEDGGSLTLSLNGTTLYSSD